MLSALHRLQEMDDVLDRAQKLFDSYDEELRRELPADAEIFDAHVHLGNDIDGMSGTLRRAHARSSIVTASHAASCSAWTSRTGIPRFVRRTTARSSSRNRSNGRVIPFVRLDLSEDPVEEAIRCLDLGARGIKLHPRAQRFLLNDQRLAPIFELAAERRVPILIHGGRGLPPIADHLARLVEANPGAQLIIAHGGIADLAALAECFGGKAGVFFDTSVWSPVDLLDMFRHISAEQVLFASDYPYGQQPASLLIALRTAKASGLDEEDLRNMLGRTAARIADGKPPLETSAPRGGDVFTQPMIFARIHQYLSMATPLLWTRQPDTIGVLGLALNATNERNGSVPEDLERIKELLSVARDLWRSAPEVEDEQERRQLSRMTFRLIHLADIWAVTADV